jgi:hypothetical protein
MNNKIITQAKGILVFIMLSLHFQVFAKTNIVIVIGDFNDVIGNSSEPQLYIVTSQDFSGNWGNNLLSDKSNWDYTSDPGGTALLLVFDAQPEKKYHIKMVDGYGDQGVAENVVLFTNKRIHFRHDRIRQNYTAYSPGVFSWDNNRLNIKYDNSKDDFLPLYSKREVHDRFLSISFLCDKYKAAHGQDIAELDFNKNTYELNAELTNYGLETLNFARWLVGLKNPITINKDLQAKAQLVALLIAKNKGTRGLIQHNIPEDLFNEALSYLNSCLTATYCGNYNLFESVKGWLSSQKSKLNARSRRCLLSPCLGQIGFGYADEDYSSAYIADINKSAVFQDKIQAWPPPGFFPNDLSLSVWSVSLNTKYYQQPKLDDVEVKLTRLSNNKVWIIDKKNFTENPSSCGPSQCFFNVDNNDYGTKNAIIFKPDSKTLSYVDGEVYKVEISGLKNKKGKPTTIAYHVEFFQIL